ncbi:hypothetical protein DAPPUDRAFT_273524 [Daphnia pulex]|uniref:Uncharacterized protein n=1 Tax=Daphnia pulex TaxID=6669 RepID=E9I3K2_DAPPU|nr:hypothetical protein DAPPUDRAFT_273524 [Daphnia pulex]|eukprot:EFX61430.1 hypothetical protein DAPPUDRAFT_273524 [Daphnia pulex]
MRAALPFRTDASPNLHHAKQKTLPRTRPRLTRVNDSQDQQRTRRTEGMATAMASRRPEEPLPHDTVLSMPPPTPPTPVSL